LDREVRSTPQLSRRLAEVLESFWARSPGPRAGSVAVGEWATREALAPARGTALGAVLGAACWVVLAALAWTVAS
jgi:hypothetical protein